MRERPWLLEAKVLYLKGDMTRDEIGLAVGASAESVKKAASQFGWTDMRRHSEQQRADLLREAEAEARRAAGLEAADRLQRPQTDAEILDAAKALVDRTLAHDISTGLESAFREDLDTVAEEIAATKGLLAEIDSMECLFAEIEDPGQRGTFRMKALALKVSLRETCDKILERMMRLRHSILRPPAKSPAQPTQQVNLLLNGVAAEALDVQQQREQLQSRMIEGAATALPPIGDVITRASLAHQEQDYGNQDEDGSGGDAEAGSA